MFLGKSKGNGLRRNIFLKGLSERLDVNKICVGFINIRERIKITMRTKRHAAKKKSKRNFEHKLVKNNIKSDSKSFYAYVRSKQKVRDRVGPLEDNVGNIITQGVLKAEELNMHFS